MTPELLEEYKSIVRKLQDGPIDVCYTTIHKHRFPWQSKWDTRSWNDVTLGMSTLFRGKANLVYNIFIYYEIYCPIVTKDIFGTYLITFEGKFTKACFSIGIDNLVVTIKGQSNTSFSIENDKQILLVAKAVAGEVKIEGEEDDGILDRCSSIK